MSEFKSNKKLDSTLTQNRQNSYLVSGNRLKQQIVIGRPDNFLMIYNITSFKRIEAEFNLAILD